MREVSSQKGKTILFVSHNMQSLKNLCQRVMVLDKGEVADIGNPDTVISNYLKNAQHQQLKREFRDPISAPGNSSIRIKKIAIIPEGKDKGMLLDTRTPLHLVIEFWYQEPVSNQLGICVRLFNSGDDCVFEIYSPGIHPKTGLISGTCTIPGNLLNAGSYYISVHFLRNSTDTIFQYESCLSFDVEDYHSGEGLHGKRMGIVSPDIPFTLREIMVAQHYPTYSMDDAKIIKYP